MAGVRERRESRGRRKRKGKKKRGERKNVKRPSSAS